MLILNFNKLLQWFRFDRSKVSNKVYIYDCHDKKKCKIVHIQIFLRSKFEFYYKREMEILSFFI